MTKKACNKGKFWKKQWQKIWHLVIRKEDEFVELCQAFRNRCSQSSIKAQMPDASVKTGLYILEEYTTHFNQSLCRSVNIPAVCIPQGIVLTSTHILTKTYIVVTLFTSTYIDLLPSISPHLSSMTHLTHHSVKRSQITQLVIAWCNSLIIILVNKNE